MTVTSCHLTGSRIAHGKRMSRFLVRRPEQSDDQCGESARFVEAAASAGLDECALRCSPTGIRHASSQLSQPWRKLIVRCCAAVLWI